MFKLLILLSVLLTSLSSQAEEEPLYYGVYNRDGSWAGCAFTYCGGNPGLVGPEQARNNSACQLLTFIAALNSNTECVPDRVGGEGLVPNLAYSWPYYDEEGIFWGCLTRDENGYQIVERAVDDNPDNCWKWNWMGQGIGEAPEIDWVYGRAAKVLASEYLSLRHPNTKEFAELYISLGIDEVVAAYPMEDGVMTIDGDGNKWVIETTIR